MLLNIQNLQVDVDKRRLLSDINFSVVAGEHLCITGPNGAGKSTLLRTLNAMMPLSQGEIFLQQQPLRHYSKKHIARQISYVPQNSGRALPFVVEDFLRMARYPHLHWLGSTRSTDRNCVGNDSRSVGIKQFEKCAITIFNLEKTFCKTIVSRRSRRGNWKFTIVLLENG